MRDKRGDRRQKTPKSSGSPAEQWQEFLKDLGTKKALAPGFYGSIRDSQLAKVDEESITLLFSSQAEADRGQKQEKAIQNYKTNPFKGKAIHCKFNDPYQIEVDSPLQKLNHELIPTDDKGQERESPVLQTAAEADSTCQPLYDLLCQRTESLAQEMVTVVFPWRLRVGGLQGFRERLLPVFHPVYGVTYVPSSSIKGVLRAWARQHLSEVDKHEIDRLLGYLNGSQASLGKVQILDAFPTEPCLSLDVATPQWSWNGDRVEYGPSPHAMLSMKNVTLKIGLTSTSIGSLDDVRVVKEWLEQALLTDGLGSRVSAGYGRATKANELTISTEKLPLTSEHGFKLWSQGIYGANPRQREFRPAAVRGMLRYWFRAVALCLYSPKTCQALEHQLFGTLEPEAVQGSIALEVRFSEKPDALQNPKIPHHVTGRILVSARNENHLKLIQHVLRLAVHLGGVGRGARRSLHWNDDGKFSGLRGCYWEPDKQDRLDCNLGTWRSFLQELRQSFIAVQRSDGNPSGSNPGERDNRYQDVLNANAAIVLVPSAQTKHPEGVQNWRQEGAKPDVRGEALEFLYNSPAPYKGVNRQGIGNELVGGKLGTPSFVWIASNNLNNLNVVRQAYQVVTVFGTNQSSEYPPPGRQQFLAALRELSEMSVWNP